MNAPKLSLLLCGLIALLSPSKILASHHFDTLEETPTEIIGTLASKGGVTVYWLHGNSMDPRLKYGQEFRNTNPFPVEIIESTSDHVEHAKFRIEARKSVLIPLGEKHIKPTVTIESIRQL